MTLWMQIFGLLVIVWCIVFRSNLVRVELDKVASFCAFMVMVTIVRLFIVEYNITDIQSIQENKSLMFVFLEDAVFALFPTLFGIYLDKFKLWNRTTKIIYVIVWICLSVVFGLGHVYQGWYAGVLIAFLPYFISRRYGLIFGFGTVMASHVIYDVVTVFTGNIYLILN